MEIGSFGSRDQNGCYPHLILEKECTPQLMKLNEAQKAILDGKRGRAPQMAMEVIVRYARVLGAEHLCRVTWADLFCGAHHYLDVARSDDFDRIFATMSLCSAQTAALKQMHQGCRCYSGVEVDCTEAPQKMLSGTRRQAQNLAMLSRFVDSGVVLSGT